MPKSFYNIFTETAMTAFCCGFLLRNGLDLSDVRDEEYSRDKIFKWFRSSERNIIRLREKENYITV
jgi:hypothetical protein